MEHGGLGLGPLKQHHDGLLPQTAGHSEDDRIETINLGHIVDMSKHVSGKAIHQLQEKIDKALGTSLSMPEIKKSKIIEEEETLKENHSKLPMIIFGGFSMILLFLVYFVMTCKNNKQKMKKRSEYEEANQDENEMSKFGEFFGDDSDEEGEPQSAKKS